MPIIGITCHTKGTKNSDELDMLVEWIVAGVVAAGGEPLLIRPGGDEGVLQKVFAGVDGLLLSGGGDVDPACYGMGATPEVGGVDPQRDDMELALAQWAITAQKPLFGICRGLQLVNVALGGTLYRDMAEHAGALPHTFYPDYPYNLRAHRVAIVEGSRLAGIVGVTTAEVNSLHHQACDVVAPGLRVAARAPDGVVEALELPGHPFALAVQWHPEALPDAPESGALFGALVAASGRR